MGVLNGKGRNMKVRSLLGTMRVIVITLLLMIASSSPSAASGSALTGAWDSIDVDGSYQQLAIGGGSASVHVQYVDHGPSFCLRHGARNGTVIIRGTGTISGSTLSVTFDEIRCTGGIVFPNPGGGWVFEYDALTDTLLVDFGPDENGQPIPIVWSRVGR